MRISLKLFGIVSLACTLVCSATNIVYAEPVTNSALLLAQASADQHHQGVLKAPAIDIPAKVNQGNAFPVKYSAANNSPVEIIWQNKIIPLVLEETDQGFAGEILLAMPTDVKVDQLITVQMGSLKVTKLIQPNRVEWTQSTLSVEPKYAVPPKEFLNQIEQNRIDNAAILKTYSPYNSLTFPFVRPVKGGLSSLFGEKRVFNGSTKSVHRGTDFRGAVGTPIVSVADGIVVLAESQYYLGNTVTVDHGQGVYTSYGHLSAFSTKVGDKIKAGDEIGKIGMTGRVTGPHLHISLILQGISVDIMPLIEGK